MLNLTVEHCCWFVHFTCERYDTLTRRVMLVILAVAIVVGGWWFVDGSKKPNDASSPKVSSTARPETDGLIEPGKKLTVAVVKDLATKLISSDRDVYGAIWAHGSVPPIAPVGTNIVITADTLKSYKTAGQIEATVTMPEKAPVAVVIYLEFTGGQWLVQGMEAK